MLVAGMVAFGISFTASILSGQVDRFDHKVRDDFFAGFSGNREAFARAMKAAEETIHQNPNHAEALVWHGAGLYFQAGMHFQKGDPEKGMELYRRAMEQMDRAVAIAPDHIGVRIPRGATLLAATSTQPMDERVKSEVRRAIEDYQRSYDLQKTQLASLSEHSLGQLLLGLGDGYSRVGESEQAKVYFDQIERLLPNTEYAKRATAWKQNGKLTPQEQRCYGCHVSK
jgi:tetratricopeptide (TPR) repeat protein